MANRSKANSDALLANLAQVSRVLGSASRSAKDNEALERCDRAIDAILNEMRASNHNELVITEPEHIDAVRVFVTKCHWAGKLNIVATREKVGRMRQLIDALNPDIRDALNPIVETCTDA